MSKRTTYLGKLIGLYYIFVAFAMMVHKAAIVDAVAALLHNAAVVFVLGLVALVAGLAMVLAHNVWSGGVLPVVVTVIGWLALFKGLLFICMPAGKLADLYLNCLSFERFFYFYGAFMLLLGIYMTYAAFRSKVQF
jgi:hypothetical protein